MRSESLAPGCIRPTGWLLRQLRIQADGLSGHLDEFWPDVAQSKWIGGDAEGWERGPSWLDGIIPLGFVLDDPRLIAKARNWVDIILTGQHEDGWLGPREDPHMKAVLDPWPIFVVLKALTQWHEATGDVRVIPAMLRVLRRLDSLLDQKPLDSWARMRWPELMLSLNWLHQRTNEAWLWDFAAKVRRQGYDWEQHFAEFAFLDRQSVWALESHVVNHAMALKTRAVDNHDGDPLAYIKILDHYHGQATGLFSGDENLAGKNPSQGTELCAVVEYLFSLEVLMGCYDQPALADRWERIAYNALPATFKPDMWAHQYDQQANQVLCQSLPENVYSTNGPDSNLFGLEPNYGCCTANMHHGWPKFVAHMWMRRAGGLAALTYAPCVVTVEVENVDVRIEVAGDYPFGEVVTITVAVASPVKFPLHLRIPAWAGGAVLEIAGKILPPPAGAFHTLEREWRGTTTIKLTLPMTVTADIRYNNSVAISRGPLLYSLAVGEDWRQLRGEAPHADWEVHPTTPWNYALCLDPERPSEAFSLHRAAIGDCPFSPQQAPVRATVQGRRLHGWTMHRNAAAPPPPSPVTSSEPLEDLLLLPYGCTNLRVTEMPWMLP